MSFMEASKGKSLARAAMSARRLLLAGGDLAGERFGLAEVLNEGGGGLGGQADLKGHHAEGVGILAEFHLAIEEAGEFVQATSQGFVDFSTGAALSVKLMEKTWPAVVCGPRSELREAGRGYRRRRNDSGACRPTCIFRRAGSAGV